MSQSAMVQIVSAVCSVSGRPLNERLSCALLEVKGPGAVPSDRAGLVVQHNDFNQSVVCLLKT